MLGPEQPAGRLIAINMWLAGCSLGALAGDARAVVAPVAEERRAPLARREQGPLGLGARARRLGRRRATGGRGRLAGARPGLLGRVAGRGLGGRGHGHARKLVRRLSRARGLVRRGTGGVGGVRGSQLWRRLGLVGLGQRALAGRRLGAAPREGQPRLQGAALAAEQARFGTGWGLVGGLGGRAGAGACARRETVAEARPARRDRTRRARRVAAHRGRR